MTTTQSLAMRAHWRDPDVKRRRRAGVRARRARRDLDDRIQRLERRIDNWSRRDPDTPIDPDPVFGSSVGEMLDRARADLHALTMRAKILDQYQAIRGRTR